MLQWGEPLRRIASAAQFNTATPILADLDPSSGSSKLDDLGEAFSNMLDERGFQIYTFQESQGKVGVKPLRKQVGTVLECSSRNLMPGQVVPKESSALNERKYEIKEFINANHMNMCTFKRRNDDGYNKFVAALNLYVTEIHKRVDWDRQATAREPKPPVAALRSMSLPGTSQMRDKKGVQNQQGGKQQLQKCM
jgi:hypothetical protein